MLAKESNSHPQVPVHQGTQGTLEQSNTLRAPLTTMRYRKYSARMHRPQ